MGTKLSCQLHFSSLFRRKSKHNHRTKEVLELNNNHDNSQFIGKLVPERYLVLFTEQITEMLFRLMNFNEPSTFISDTRKTRRFSLGSIPNSYSTDDQFSLQQLQSVCTKCRMKMLTIEEFCELKNAFYRVDNNHDNFLTRDEIRITLNYLFELTEYDIQEIISVFDINKDNRIYFQEYIGMK